MSTPSPLTTTSYAILGLLGVKPFTTYELARQMNRALGSFWPRARSKIYEEPKKLVAHGLARPSTDTVGRRPRTTYTITPKGRRALAAWMSGSGAGPVVEFEDLIRVFFAENGSKAQLLETLERVRSWSVEQTLATGHIAGEYLDGRGPFPERLPWITLVGDFLDEFLALVEDWAARAAAEVTAWPEDMHDATPNVERLERQARRFDAVVARRRAALRGGSMT
jgi:PadR family transcriptional regulator, regulatory protein AphA